MPRNVLLTGGSSGLGLALAHALAARGDRLALVARDPRKLERAAAEVRARAAGARVVVRAVDVRDGAALDAAVASIADELGGLDVLVNSAGILREGPFDAVPDAEHREIMEINYFGALNAIRAALPHLRRARAARVVNVASLAGLSGVYGYTAYCASKHALVGFTESLRFELAPEGIVVQLICPGEFDSPMVEALDGKRSAENLAHTRTVPKVSVFEVVESVLRGLDGDAFMIVPGRAARWAARGVRVFPGLGRWLGDRKVRAARARR